MQGVSLRCVALSLFSLALALPVRADSGSTPSSSLMSGSGSLALLGIRPALQTPKIIEPVPACPPTWTPIPTRLPPAPTLVPVPTWTPFPTSIPTPGKPPVWVYTTSKSGLTLRAECYRQRSGMYNVYARVTGDLKTMVKVVHVSWSHATGNMGSASMGFTPGQNQRPVLTFDARNFHGPSSVTAAVTMERWPLALGSKTTIGWSRAYDTEVLDVKLPLEDLIIHTIQGTPSTPLPSGR